MTAYGEMNAATSPLKLVCCSLRGLEPLAFAEGLVLNMYLNGGLRRNHVARKQRSSFCKRDLDL